MQTTTHAPKRHRRALWQSDIDSISVLEEVRFDDAREAAWAFTLVKEATQDAQFFAHADIDLDAVQDAIAALNALADSLEAENDAAAWDAAKQKVRGCDE